MLDVFIFGLVCGFSSAVFGAWAVFLLGDALRLYEWV